MSVGLYFEGNCRRIHLEQSWTLSVLRNQLAFAVDCVDSLQLDPLDHLQHDEKKYEMSEKIIFDKLDSIDSQNLVGTGSCLAPKD